MENKNKLIQYECDRCGGTDVRAECKWNYETQKWELNSGRDEDWCSSCGDSTHIIEKII